MTNEERKAYFIKAMEIGRLKGLAESLEFTEMCYDSLHDLIMSETDMKVKKLLCAKAFQADHMRLKATNDFIKQLDEFEGKYGFRPEVKSEPMCITNLIKIRDGRIVLANRVNQVEYAIAHK